MFKELFSINKVIIKILTNKIYESLKEKLAVQGFLNVFKPKGMTSAKVVYLLRKKINIKKIGHMGTLDPLAQGVLPIAINKATKMFDYFLTKNKTYIATFSFGTQTDSFDSTGRVLATSKTEVTKAKIEKKLEKFTGNISQIPPIFSAKNIDGVRAYELARKNIEVKLSPNNVEVFEFVLQKQLEKNVFTFKIVCSSGTYIRSLANDLGLELNTYAHMTELIRVESGVFNEENSTELDDILNMDISELEKKIIPIHEVFSAFDKIYIDNQQFSDIINGRVKIFEHEITKNTFVFHNNKLLGVACFGNELKLKTNLVEKE